jgi:hypothetical protein
MRRVLVALSVCALACGDPVHDNQVDALGAEQGDVGPLHRPGQPCLACHGGSGPAKAEFAFGGTVYKEETSDGYEGVDVQLTDATQTVKHITTNRAGNLYIGQESWQPIAPIHVQISFQDVTAQMATHIGRDGSCASCHYEPRGPASAGRVVLSVPNGPATDGGP